jgi:hypothetical protein
MWQDAIFLIFPEEITAAQLSVVEARDVLVKELV